MTCYCDVDPCYFSEKIERKARKNHTCCECGEIIEKGDSYTYYSFVYDGYWSHDKVCEYCEHDWIVLIKAGHCKIIGELRDTWEEYWRDQ